MSGASTDRRFHEGTAIARQMLEAVLLALSKLPRSSEREVVSDRLNETLASLSAPGTSGRPDDQAVDRLEQARAAVARLAEALEATSSGDVPKRLASVAEQLGRCRELAIDVVVARQDQLLRRPVGDASPGAAVPFRASLGVPSLHVLGRAPLEPLLQPHAAEDGADDDEDESEPEPASGPRSDPPTPRAKRRQASGLTAEQQEHLRWCARDCLSDIAALSNLRVPLGELPWAVAESFEARLLVALDTLLALGMPIDEETTGWGVLEEAQRYGAEAYVPDPGRQFARAFSLCCAAGEDTVRATLLALRQAQPSTHAAVRDALCLAPNPAIGPLVAELLTTAEAELVPLGCEVLRFRRELSFAALVPLTAHLDPRVTAAAARGLGYVEHAEPAVDTLRRLLDEDDDDTVGVEAATSLLLQNERRGLEVIRERLADVGALSERARLGFLRVLAVAGGATDLELFRSCLAPTPRDAELVGWFGHQGLGEWLLHTLQAANEGRASTRPLPHPLEVATARALVRLTGADLREEPLSGIAYDFDAEPALSVEIWTPWWLEHASELDPGQKWRFGRPFEPAGTVAELLGPCRAQLRIDGALELGLLTGPSRFEPGDWVARQRLVLQSIAAELQTRSPYRPGSWPAENVARRR